MHGPGDIMVSKISQMDTDNVILIYICKQNTDRKEQGTENWLLHLKRMLVREIEIE